MSDSTSQLNQVSQSAIQREATINANFAQMSGAAMFGYNSVTSSGLTWGYMGGRQNGTSLASGTVALTASNTNYVVAHKTTLAVSVSTATTNWNDTTTYGRCYLVVAGASTVTSYEDHRTGANGIFPFGTFIGGTLTSPLNYATTATVASATTTDIGAASSNYVSVTGTTTITGLGTIAAGASRIVTFAGILTLTHNATSLILPGAANITTAAGDCAEFVSLGSGNWRCVDFERASGQALVGATVAGSNTQVIFNDSGAAAGDAGLVFDKTNNVLTSRFAVDSSGINVQTGTTYTLVAADNGGVVTLDNAAAITVTVPSGLGVGFNCICIQIGAGQVTFSASGVTINPSSTLKISAQHGAASLIAYASNVFNLTGSISA